MHVNWLWYYVICILLSCSGLWAALGPVTSVNYISCGLKVIIIWDKNSTCQLELYFTMHTLFYLPFYLNYLAKALLFYSEIPNLTVFSLAGHTNVAKYLAIHGPFASAFAVNNKVWMLGVSLSGWLLLFLLRIHQQITFAYFFFFFLSFFISLSEQSIAYINICVVACIYACMTLKATTLTY